MQDQWLAPAFTDSLTHTGSAHQFDQRPPDPGRRCRPPAPCREDAVHHIGIAALACFQRLLAENRIHISALMASL